MNIGGYELEGEFTSKGAGNGSWTSAKKNGEKYFIKQLKETYCTDSSSLIGRKRMEADKAREDRLSRLLGRLKIANDGNLIIPMHTLKHEGHYYVITKWVEQMDDFNKIMACTNYQKLLMMKVLAHSLMGLAEQNVVHNDLKPDNIRIKQTVSNARTLKIIDFGASFIAGDYPDKVSGDIGYVSPELYLRMQMDEREMDDADKIPISPKSDIFSLGLIFHEIFTGSKPKILSEKTSCYAEAVGHHIPLEYDKSIPDLFTQKLFPAMLALEPEKRISAGQVFHFLKQVPPAHLWK